MLKLHIGCGPRVIKGWTNIDLVYQPWEPFKQYYPEVIYPFSERGTIDDFMEFDVSCKPLPFDNNSVDLIFHEDFIEHLDQRECILFLAETYRVMKEGAIQRINTPDLIWSQIYLGHLEDGYSGVHESEWLKWGHKNLFTRGYLEDIADLIGFEIVFQQRDFSLSKELPREFRPTGDRAEAGNIFADLIKPTA